MINKEGFRRCLVIFSRAWSLQPGVCLCQIHVLLFVAIMAVFPQGDLVHRPHSEAGPKDDGY